MIYILLADDANKEGVQAIGPFKTRQDACDFQDGEGGGWTIIEVTQWNAAP